MIRIREHIDRAVSGPKQARQFVCADLSPVTVRLYVNMATGLIRKETAP